MRQWLWCYCKRSHCQPWALEGIFNHFKWNAKQPQTLLYFCQEYCNRIRLYPVIIMYHPFLSIVVANCWVVRMEIRQNNNTVVHQMNFNTSRVQHSQTFIEKQTGYHQSRKKVVTVKFSHKNQMYTIGYRARASKTCYILHSGLHTIIHTTITLGCPLFVCLFYLTNSIKSLWARETAGPLVQRLRWMTKEIFTEQENETTCALICRVLANTLW